MLLLCLSFYQKKVDTPNLRLFQDSFVVRLGAQKADVPIQLPREKPALSVSFRKNQTYAVWDDRGLTIRIGKTAKSTRLEEIAVTPKIFTADEIRETAGLIKAKKRSKKAASLSGARRIGTTVYFLLRWEDSAGKPWMESLVSVDLAKPTFHPTLLARLPGLSLADKPIDDKLILLGNQMSIVARQKNDWGLATYEIGSKQFEFKEIGTGLESYTELSNRLGAFVEKTVYNTHVGGRVDLVSLTRRNLIEAKGTMRFVDNQQPLFALINHGDDTIIRNVDTGAETTLLSSVAMRRTNLGLVVWSPFKAPKRAWLYETSRWTPLATWTPSEP
ncbi:MAG: hypothetical protein BGO01_15445 [Armatimonadetes bacterium 55-13]|nr:hypothetical protein [Armatimonadota bacterium]OJU65259.1 MAG: hypothetical protein BGO01_15445 [Armatimonadetes bacterium 55-13]